VFLLSVEDVAFMIEAGAHLLQLDHG